MSDKIKEIDGQLYEELFLSGAANLKENAQIVNDLNVFPIPDGDTGENMFLTIKGGVDGLKNAESPSLGDKASAIASGMLLGARGNSGVILSQLFYGIAEGLKGKTSVTIEEFAAALGLGVKCAYGAVAKPVEGTMLTVAREATAKASESIDENTTVASFFDKYLEEMKSSLERTPDLLEVLKEAGVIDSGGAGLVYIAEGFCKALGGESVKTDFGSEGEKNTAVDFSKFDENCEMVYGYCTEMLVRLQKSKTDVDAFSVEDLVAFLESVGDSVVAFKTGTIIKIHVHTLTPWKVFQHCQTFGEFLTVKVENMTLQHNETVAEKKEEALFKMPKKVRKHKKFATVTVASGDGLTQVFEEMGADFVINGGQTNNPSAEDFIEAFDEVNADVIFVLPNNGNIILAAKQASEMYDKADVRVIESKSIGHGYSILSMLDYGSDDADEIESRMASDMQDIITGLIAKSVRTTSVNGVKVGEGEYMGFAEKVMYVSTPDRQDALFGLIEKLDTSSREYLILIYGKTVSEEEREAVASLIGEKYPMVEFYEIDGGQDVYDYILVTQ